MKNLKKLMALLAALALVLAAGCDTSGDSAGGDSASGGGGNTTSVVDYETLDGGWHVYTAKGLQEWAEYVNDGNYSTNCTLGANIDMEKTQPGRPWTATAAPLTAAGTRCPTLP